MAIPTVDNERIITAMRKVLEGHGVFIVYAPSYDPCRGYQFPAILRGRAEAMVLADILHTGMQHKAQYD